MYQFSLLQRINMICKIVAFFALVAVASAAPQLPVVAASAPFVAAAPLAVSAPVTTSHSSQVITRNHNALAGPVLAEVEPLAYTAPVAPALAAYTGPVAYTAQSAVAYTAPGSYAYSVPAGLAYSAPYTAIVA